MKSISFVLLACCFVMFTGCADLTVKKVNLDGDQEVAGVRYSLPKPFIQVVPQGDGTISVSVVYLPDTENTYAIDTTSFMSNYVFQVSLDQNGLLNAVEFKKSTSVVGQQLAATSGAMTAQVLNTHNAQLVASQTAVDAAQGAVDSAKATRDAAQQKYDLADAAGKLAAQIELKQAEAKLADALQVLDRAKNTARAVQITASAGTPPTTSSLTPGTAGFGLPKWTPLPVYPISGSRGAVLFAVNDYIDEKDKKKNKVELTAAKIDKEAQHIFRTINIPAGPPALEPQGITYFTGVEGVENVSFKFSQDVTKITGQSLVTTAKPPAKPTEVKDAPKAELKTDLRTVVMPFKTLPKGSYELTLSYVYSGGTGFAKVTFGLE